jgi:hypothetical protein
MKPATSCRWFVTLSFVSLSAFVVSAPPADSQSLAGSGSLGSRPGGSHETHTQPKPKGSKPDSGIRSMRPSDTPGQTLVPRDRTEALEERLRNGQMDQPIAQGEISDRLEQLHRGAGESSTGDTATGQSPQ